MAFRGRWKVVCPISGKVFYHDSLVETRRFVVRIMDRLGTCPNRIRIYNCNQYYGSMWKKGPVVWYQRKGARAHRKVNYDGTIDEV